MIVKCKITDNKLPIKESKEIKEFIIKNNTKNVRIEILNADRRSLRLNAYYWGAFLQTLCQFWYKEYGQLMSAECMNDELKKEFCYYVKDNVKHVKSTKDMTISQLLDFFKTVDRWSEENFGQGIPKPNDVETWNDSFLMQAVS